MSKRKIRYDPTNDYYNVLGITPNASVDEITRAYRQKAKEVHPDRNPARLEWAKDQFQRINDAQDVLLDVELRREYDQRRDGKHVGTRFARYQAERMTYQETSRAIWRRRHRRNTYPTLFFLSLCVVVFSCMALQVVRDTEAQAATQQATYRAEVALATRHAECRPERNPNTNITYPQEGARLAFPFRVIGSATGPDFVSYSVILKATPVEPEAAATLYILKKDVTQAVDNNVLVETTEMQNLKLPSGEAIYMLQLTVTRNFGGSFTTCRIEVSVENFVATSTPAPLITNTPLVTTNTPLPLLLVNPTATP